MKGWFRTLFRRDDGWRILDFKCPFCSLQMNGLENLVRDEMNRHKCLEGCIIVEDERSER